MIRIRWQELIFNAWGRCGLYTYFLPFYLQWYVQQQYNDSFQLKFQIIHDNFSAELYFGYHVRYWSFLQAQKISKL